MAELLIYSKTFSPRLQYVLELLFGDDINWQTTDDTTELLNARKRVIQYGGVEKMNPDSLWIPAADLLFNTNINGINTETVWVHDLPLLFVQPNADLPADLFASIFFWASRYEEYLPSENDNHGRFKAINSHAHQNAYLELPVIDAWRKKVFELIGLENYIHPALKARLQWTFDIDQWSAFKGRSIGRNLGSLARDLIQSRWSAAIDRLKVWFGITKDPYQDFKQYRALGEKAGLPTRYFLHVGRLSAFDRNARISVSEIRDELPEAINQHQIGLHPSYTGAGIKDTLQIEKSNLEKLLGYEIHSSRQHYVKLEFPSTYRLLLEIGIQEDWSMGYPEMPGFRAGTGRLFKWFDLDKNRVTDLVVHPFAGMDVSLKDYLKLSPAESITRLKKLTDAAFEYNFPLTLIWHNSSFYPTYGWAGWEKIPEEINQYFLGKLNKKNIPIS